MADPKKLPFLKRICKRYKYQIINERMLEVLFSFRASALQIVSLLLIYGFLSSFLAILLFTQTPLSKLLPDDVHDDLRDEMVMNALRADSLSVKLMQQARYIDNIKRVFAGQPITDSASVSNVVDSAKHDFAVRQTDAEKQFVSEYEEEMRYALTSVETELGRPTTLTALFNKPIQGAISQAFDPEKGHFGIDLTAAEGKSVLATLDGVVMYTGFDQQQGYVILLQHDGGFTSAYKHNSIILKKIGDKVYAGEAIATIGNTGAWSSGTHLHFELWHNGAPVDPQKYIVF